MTLRLAIEPEMAWPIVVMVVVVILGSVAVSIWGK